jgi:hypothetical protein
LVKETGYSKKAARTGVVMLIQRFSSALNPNIDLHGAQRCAPPYGRPAVVQIGSIEKIWDKKIKDRLGHI